MEQALGHVTHHQNLMRWVEQDPEVQPTWLPIPEHAPDLWERLPGIRGNWSLKASLRARDALRVALQHVEMDALLWHTQTTALMAPPFMRHIPSIVSLDATPINYDTIGAAYSHVPSRSAWLERRKHRWHSSTFQHAAAIITWCDWARDSLVADYDVPREKVTVIPPGVDVDQWRFDRGSAGIEQAGRPLRLLFVGGDFARKGGHDVLAAFQNGLSRDCELDIVTRDPGAASAAMDGVRVHQGLTANCEPLRDLYAQADLFVFPTLADCLPLAVMEAMAAGLPIITTNVGALPEEVEDGLNGIIVPPADPDSLVAAIRTLRADPGRRRTMSRVSRKMAEEKFAARRNYGRVIDLMKRCAHENGGIVK